MDFLLQSYSRFSLALLFFLLLALPILGGQAAWGEAAGRSLSSPGRTPDHTSASLPPSGGPGAELSPIVAGYYPYYARMDGFLPGDLAAQHLTHIHYAFAGVDEAGRAVLENPSLDLANFAGLRALKEEHPGLRTLLSVGGWDYSRNFSLAASDPEHRQAFAQTAAGLMEEHGFDGLDLDWEFPVSGGKEGNLHSPQDGENYRLLLQAVRQELDARGAAAGRRYLLTAAIPPGEGFRGNVQSAPLAESADYLFLMGYDLSGPWERQVGFSAPLSAPGEQPSIRRGVDAYLAEGVPPEKLVLGVPFYGYLYRFSGSGEEGLGSPFRSAQPGGYDTVTSRYLEEGRRDFSLEAQQPTLSGDGWFLVYDDPSSIAAKARLAQEKGLAGVGSWELSQDREARLLSTLAQTFCSS